MVSPDYEEPGSHKMWILLETAGGQVSTTCYHYNQLTCVPHKNCLYIDLCVGYMPVICNGKEQQLTTCSLPESPLIQQCMVIEDACTGAIIHLKYQIGTLNYLL